ncbi:hypothetical protein SAMD00079811_35670 [Scytonema sp. HK-05]|nr:hypothetical protein SAMD00079811_35670 [Scytonema sp. HK-05]
MYSVTPSAQQSVCRVEQLFGFHLPSYPTQLIFGYCHQHRRNRLDSSVAPSTDSHLPTLAVKRPPNPTGDTKTNIVVDVVALRPIVVVAGRGTAVFRIVDPGTAPQSGSPIPSLLSRPSEKSKYLLAQLPSVSML